jgi:predicted secreted protein
MTKSVGRATVLKKNGTAIAGVRTKTLSWGGESIDVTSNEDGGVRLLLDESAQEQIDITFDGVEDGTTIRDIWANPATSRMLTDIEYEFADGSTITGNFRLTSYELSSPYNEATAFSASLESSGLWTYTPAP